MFIHDSRSSKSWRYFGAAFVFSGTGLTESGLFRHIVLGREVFHRTLDYAGFAVKMHKGEMSENAVD